MKNVLKVTYILILAVLLNIAFIWITNKPTHYVVTITTQNNVVLEQTYSINEYNCVVQALYHEARGEGKEGVLAVASVIQNRVLSGVYPDEHCQVIHQPKQFSYVHELRNKGQGLDVNPKPTEQEIYEFIQVVAKDMVQFEFNTTLPKDVLWYAHKRVNNFWTRKKEVVVRIGNHVFYKKP